MGWQEDLADLLGDFGGGVESTAGATAERFFGSTVGRPVAEALQNPLAQGYFNFMSLPLTGVKYGTGALLGGINRLPTLVPGGADFFDPAMGAAFEEGGPLGAWEQRRSVEPRWFQAPTEALLDPTTYLGGSVLGIPGRAGSRAAQALRVGARGAELAERPLIAGAARAGARAADVGQFLWNDHMDIAAGAAGKAGRAAYRTVVPETARARVGSVVGKMTGLAPEFEVRRQFAASANANWAERSAAGGERAPTVAAMTREAGPPLVPHPHPDGSAPSNLYLGFLDAWENSWLKRKGKPKSGILGVMAGTREHGYASKPPTFSEEHFDTMARAGAGLMQVVNDDQQLFGGVKRAAELAPEWRNAMVGEHGEEIIPALPFVWERMRELHPDLSLPSSRFALPHAYPFESVSGKRLGTAQEIYAKGDYAPEARAEALARIRDFPIGSPEAVEAAAAQGAAFLSLFRKGGTKELFRPGGEYFPSELTTKRRGVQRAVTPEGFSRDVWQGGGAIPHELTGEQTQKFLGAPDAFGSNRQAWEAYMQDLYGEMKPDELETLAQMSEDILYNEYVNAANDYALGAAAFAKGERVRRGDAYSKVGTRAEDYVDEQGRLIPASAQRAANKRILVDNPNIRRYGAGGSISEHSALSEQLRIIEGKEGKITREDINAILGTPRRKKAQISIQELKDAITARGETPLQRNVRGGLLPNLEEMFNLFEDAKDLPLVKGLPSPADDWYGRGAREMAMIVGWGNYKQARMFLHLMALTSSSTSVERNAKNALRALAEFEFGHDTLLRDKYGITGQQLTEMVDSQILGRGISQRDQIQELFNVAKDKRAMPPMGLPGAKEFNYAGSFLQTFWRKQLDEMVSKLPPHLEASLRKRFDDALSLFTVDRHHSRVENGPTAVSAIQMHLSRERGLLSARARGVGGPEFQAAAWYWARDRQGFLRMFYPNSDVGYALRKVVQDIYDKGAPDGETWQQLVNKTAEETGLEGDELYKAVYDLAREDIFYRVMESSFKEKGVADALAKAGFPTTLSELSHQVHGVIARGAHGLYPDEWPNPLSQAMDLGVKIEQLAANPPAGPTIFNFSSGSWEPVAGASHAVPIMDAGTFSPGQAQTARKLLERLISKDIVAQVFDPVQGDRASQLGIGIVPDGAKYRLGLYALTADAATAEAGAARSGAKHLVDLGAGTMTPTTVTGPRQASLPTLLDEMFGEAPQLPRPSRDEAMRRGITMAEMDTRNPISLLQRKVINPLMDAYEALSAEEGLPNMADRGMADLDVPMWEGDGGGLTRRGYNTRISANDNAALMRTTTRGESHRAIIAKGAQEGGAAQEALRAAGVHWKPYASLADRQQAVRGNAELTKLVNKWHRLGIDPLYAQHPDDIGLALLEREMRKDAGLKTGRTTVPQLLAAAWGEQVLASGKYLTGNVFGNWLMAAVAGHTISLSPNQYLAGFKLLRQGVDGVTRAEALESLKGTQLFRKWGLDGLPNEVMRGGIREVTSNATRFSPSATGELAGRLTGSERVARAVGTPFIIINDLAAGADVVARSSVMGDIFDAKMTEMIPYWEADVQRAGASIPGFEFSVSQHINQPAGGMHTDALFETLTELGINDGQAERLVRDFSNLRGKALTEAREGMHRILFSFDKTVADTLVGKVAPFTYWPSRALRFWAEESIRHPGLMISYMRAQDGIEAAQSDPGLSARQKGFIKLFGTPIGFSLLMEPMAFLGVQKALAMDDAYESDGQTAMGGVISWLKKFGFGLYPWIDGTANLMGIYGNTFEPDLLGLRHKALVGAAINFVRAYAGFEPAGAPYADAMGQLRYSVSSFVDSFTPDWLAQTVTPRPGNSYQEAALDTLIENVIIGNNPQLTNQQLLDIMTDPESPEYQAAFQQAATAGLVSQLLTFTAPTPLKMRHDARDVRLAQMQTIREAAEAAGVAPYDFAPTPQDLAFKAKYKALTGRDWKPGDYQSAKLRNDLANAPTENKQFILDEATYYDLGTPKQQRALDKYQAILFGSDPISAGVTDEGARRELANRWADTHGAAARHVTDMYAVRNTFESTHADFAEFKDWSGRVRNLAAFYGGSLAEYRRRVSAASPNAARYFAEQQAWIQSHMPQESWAAELDRITTSVGAYQAITGKGTTGGATMAQTMRPEAWREGGAPTRLEQGPFPGAPAYDPTLPQMEPAPYEPTTNWASEASRVFSRVGM